LTRKLKVAVTPGVLQVGHNILEECAFVARRGWSQKVHECCLPNREWRRRRRERQRGETGVQAALRKRWLSERVLKA